MTIIATLLFAIAATAVAGVLLNTLAPALPRIIALFLEGGRP